ncbi:hypothetical protein [Spirobacillus cienkowskii]|uniref:hypothetical protein n=1 Tax=Spirobacillus cienkowskii TaxID=495820 RepID=UPI0030D23D2E
MRKFYYYAITFLIFLFHFKSYSLEEGYLWIPLSWTFTLDKNESELKQINIKSVKLYFQDINSKKDIYSYLDLPEKNKKLLALNSKSIRTSFFSKKLIKFPAGNYYFYGCIIEIVKNNSPTELFIEFPKFFEQGNNVFFQVSDKKISPFPAISTETILGFKKEKFYQHTTLDLIDDEYIPVNEVFVYISSLKNSIKNKPQGFVIANNKFPPLQVLGDSLKSVNSNRLGLIIDITCNIQGTMKFVWTSQENNLQYVFYNNLNNKNQNCKSHNFIPINFHLPDGKWFLHSMTLNKQNKVKRIFETYLLNSKDKFAKKYFKILDGFYFSLNIKERSLLKVIEISLYGNKSKNGIFYLGSTEVKKNENDELFFYFKRNYEIYNIKKIFSVKQIYNAYTLELMKKDRIIGDIQFKTVTMDKKYNPKSSIYLDQIREFVKSDLSICISDQEVFDPLFLLNGYVIIKNNKNFKNILVNKNDFNFDLKGMSQNKIIDCMIETFSKFSFKQNVTVPFKFKIIFESY